MTPKERAAMQQALEALEGGLWDYGPGQDEHDKCNEVITALREALDHSGEADEMVVGWDRVKPEAIASDPLYQQGFVDGVEEGRNQVAEQADVKESFTTQFIPVGIVNDQHCITWMEEIVDDQAPIGAILYAKEQL